MLNKAVNESIVRGPGSLGDLVGCGLIHTMPGNSSTLLGFCFAASFGGVGKFSYHPHIVAPFP